MKNITINSINFIITITMLIFISCSDDNESKSSYKKKTDIPITGQSIDKKIKPNKKVSDFY